MAASINASTSAGVVTTADTTGNLNLQSNGTTIIGYTSAGATVTGTLSAAGIGSFTNANPSISVGNGNAAAGSIRFNPWTATNYNWLIDNGVTTVGTLNFSPSTVVGGNTYTTPVVAVSTTGLAVTGALSATGNFSLGAVNDGITKSFSVYTGGGAEGTIYGSFVRTNGGSNSLTICNANDYYANAADSACKMGRNSVNSRSLNAGGTVNASGADYAEYMTKVGDFAIAKGDVIGIDAQGKLTNVFSESVSFVVKSTDPSYVGGDSWGNENAIGKIPTKPVQLAATDDVEAEIDEAFAVRMAQYEADKTAFDAALEAARQKVDRIAFAGQVPVNVMDATAGQYILPINDNGAIKGKAVSNPTFEQYQSAVGKVIAIEPDGRAKIIVKVA